MHIINNKVNIFMQVERINLIIDPVNKSEHLIKYEKIYFSDDYFNNYNTWTVDEYNTDKLPISFPPNSGVFMHESRICSKCGMQISV